MQVNTFPISGPGNRAAGYLRSVRQLHEEALSKTGANLAWAVGELKKVKGPDAIFHAFAALECIVDRLAVFDPVGRVEARQAAQFKRAAQKAAPIIEARLSDRRSRFLVRCGFAAAEMLLDVWSVQPQQTAPDERRALLRQWVFLAVRLLDAECRLHGLEAAYGAEIVDAPEKSPGSLSAKLIPFPARLLAEQRERVAGHG